MTRSQIIGVALSGLVALCSLAVLVWLLASGQAMDLDALFLILVCLLFLLLFAIPPAQMIRSGAWRQVVRTKKAASAAQQDAPVSHTASQKS